MLRGVILQAPEPLLRLLSDSELSLADWYGEPLDIVQADYWAMRLQSQLQNSRGSAQVRFRDRLAELIARYWSARDAEMSYYSLIAAAADDFQRALLELCYGQLLLARKRQASRKHLDAGFLLAVNLLPPDDYFRVMKRHKVLAALPLSDKTSTSFGLEALLKEAIVISNLVGSDTRSDRPAVGKRSDTLG